MFIAALPTTAKVWEEPKCPSTEKLWHIYTVEHDSAIKSPFATTWMELEGSILSEISQSEKDKYRILLRGI